MTKWYNTYMSNNWKLMSFRVIMRILDKGCLDLTKRRVIQIWIFVPVIYLYHLFIYIPGFSAAVVDFCDDYQSICGRMGHMAILVWGKPADNIFWQCRFTFVFYITYVYIGTYDTYQIINTDVPQQTMPTIVIMTKLWQFRQYCEINVPIIIVIEINSFPDSL